MRKTFTPRRAEAMIPSIVAMLEQARIWKQKARSERAGATAFLLRGRLKDYALKRSMADEAMRKLQDALLAFEKGGCILRDLLIGVVDFPSQRSGKAALLCWRQGEKAILYWHGPSEGFSHRKLISATRRDDFNHV